ncbi:MAG: hypothetical protein K2Y37_10180 [Pirellulales bacterium]|nr:hypothetical protein [Pirellulales bacterium]
MAIRGFSRRLVSWRYVQAKVSGTWFVGMSLLALGSLGVVLTASATDPPPPESLASDAAAKPRFETVSLHGKVVWLGEALQRRYGIELDADDVRSAVALETADDLFPLAKDSRGRGFWLDERLRDTEVELLVRRYQGSPVLKVIRVFALKPDAKYELDYWCSVCSIPMYELKACECCQGPTELRLRRVDHDDP